MDDTSAMTYASDFYDAMCAAEVNRRREATRLLETELSYLRRAMILQVSAFFLLRPHLPFTDRKPSAANVLGFSIFDHLRQGWSALLNNYCLVSMTIGRNVFEAIVFLTAIGVSIAADFRGHPNAKIDAWLDRWWRDKFKAGTVQHLITQIDDEIRRGSTDSNKSNWASSAESLWLIVRSWAHAAWVPIGMSGTPIKQSNEDASTPAISFGGQLPTPETSKLVGYFYSHFAVDAVFALGMAFTPQLAVYSEWWKHKDDLITEHQQWSRSIGIAKVPNREI
jgi:hypothetical protein